MSPPIPNIVDSIPSDADHKSFTDRYFSRRYCINANGVPRNDHLLLFHSNRLCVVTLAPGHPLFDADNADFDINFQVGNADRTKNQVKGKGKKGGQIMEKNTRLCRITLKDGTAHDVLGCINGKLIEINESLLQDPTLLRKSPDSDGYVAIILSNISVSDSRKNELLTHEDYMLELSSRDVNC